RRGRAGCARARQYLSDGRRVAAAARPRPPARAAAPALDEGDAGRGRRADRRPPRQQGGGGMIEHFLVGLALLLGLFGGYLIASSRWRGKRSERPQAVHQILLPFTGTEISRRAVDAALRLARAEDATLMPAYLATVPKQLPLECPIPNEAARAMPMLEAIEQRAATQEVPVDARIEQGRSYRHALRRLL